MWIMPQGRVKRKVLQQYPTEYDRVKQYPARIPQTTLRKVEKGTWGIYLTNKEKNKNGSSREHK